MVGRKMWEYGEELLEKFLRAPMDGHFCGGLAMWWLMTSCVTPGASVVADKRHLSSANEMLPSPARSPPSSIHDWARRGQGHIGQVRSIICLHGETVSSALKVRSQ